jgi:hypothetical protein
VLPDFSFRQAAKKLQQIIPRQKNASFEMSLLRCPFKTLPTPFLLNEKLDIRLWEKLSNHVVKLFG